MPTALARKALPAGLNPSDFTYKGRPAKEDGDFGPDVGIADMGCVNQFGEANNSKAYHCGVVQSTDGRWWMYAEWGRIQPGPSWNGTSWTRNFQDFQFTPCSSEAEARAAFKKKAESKNTKRGRWDSIAGVRMLVAKPGKDCYVVQDLATREKGLPDALTIKDSSGVATKPAASAPKKKAAKARPTKTFQPEVVALAQALVGGTQQYTRALSAASGVTPTMASITRVRDQLIPAAMERIRAVGPSLDDQVQDQGLQALTRTVAALVPRPMPRGGQDSKDFLLSGGTILTLQQDLDAFEASLGSEDFSTAAPATTVDPDQLLNAQLRYLPPNSPEGKWVRDHFPGMSNDRHGYLRKPMQIKYVFRVERPDRDAGFRSAVDTVAAKRQGRFSLRANLQPARTDLSGQGVADKFAQANVIVGIHGTRPVNIAPILGSNFRLPRSLPGAQITGANFGHGIYFATDWRKSYGYTGRGYWGNNGGGVSHRGCFMFLCDMIMGDAYRAPRTGSWASPPNDKDSVFGVGGDRGHRLENDEHIIFDPNYQRIRYVVEFDWLT